MKTVGDVNVLFALLVSGHAHHERAWQWWQVLADESLALSGSRDLACYGSSPTQRR